jgi:hypothetical protein
MKRDLDDSVLAKVVGGTGTIDDPTGKKPGKGGPEKPTTVPEDREFRAPLADYDPE